MAHYIEIDSKWEEPGAEVFDEIDTDFNSAGDPVKIQLFGGYLDTSAPTPPGEPLLLSFNISDGAGNSGTFTQAIGRQVHVVCRDNEVFCPGDQFNPVPTCSVGGLCLSPELTEVLTVNGLSDWVSEPINIEVQEVSLRLLGQEIVTLTQGSGVSYGPCSGAAAPLDNCDPGAVGSVNGALAPVTRCPAHMLASHQCPWEIGTSAAD
eukprot:scaffold346984_cov47-Prasinocladus_malaysianus.AAC.1